MGLCQVLVVQHFCKRPNRCSQVSLNEILREFVMELLAHAHHDLPVPARVVAQRARHVLVRHVLPLALEASPHLGEVVLLGRVKPEETFRLVDPFHVLSALTADVIQMLQDELVKDGLIPFCEKKN